MGTLWFCLVALMLAGYIVLDGFDIGAGVLHLFVARTDDERRTVLRSIGPVWDGNEVWLIAAGGTLYFAFPALYAAGFSGFYLPLMMVLWQLIVRGISIEFRGHVAGRIWTSFWDATFAISSIMLAIFFGAALGNVVRGVPLSPAGYFFEPLWTNFLPRGETGILDWYTVLVGVASLAALALHGAAWLALKTEEPVQSRAFRAISCLWWAVTLLTAGVTVASFRLLPDLSLNFRRHPWGCIFPILAITALLAMKFFQRSKGEFKLFASSCAYLIGMLTSVAFGLYPNVLPSSINPYFGLTVANAKAADYGLKIGLIWWILGMALAVSYTVHSYRNFAGRVSSSPESGHY